MSTQVVGMIGLGIMGSAMSANLMRAGYKCRGIRRPSGAPPRASQSGWKHRTSTIAGEWQNPAEIVVTSLPSGECVNGHCRGASLQSALAQPDCRRNKHAPHYRDKEEARKLLAARGILMLDCTLSGTGAQARAKDLVVYASGDRKAYTPALQSVLDGFSRAHYYVGAFGAGSKIKFVANLLVAIHNVAAAEAMVLARKAGLDLATVLKVIADGAGTSRMFEVRGPMMVKGDYSDATMKVQVWQKDMTIIGEFARKLDCPTPLFSASAPIYTAAMAMGMSAEDTGSVCAVLEQMANCRRAPRSEKVAIANAMR